MAYILGRREFWSLDLQVNRTVLVPRPETETLVSEVLRRLPPPLLLPKARAGAGGRA